VADEAVSAPPVPAVAPADDEARPEPAPDRARDDRTRLVVLIAALVLVAFAAGFALGLIVH
jgi:hypothetical protein